jgi:hypothetical protein
MDLVMQIAWIAAAAAAVVLVRRRRGSPRAIWRIAAAGLVVIALDKALDLQNLLLALAKWGVRELAGGDLGEHRQLLRDALLVAATIAGVAFVVWLSRRERARERGSLLALTGLAMVAVLVGLRLVPAFGTLHDERVGWLVEAVALACVGAGLRRGFAPPAPEAVRD